MAIDMFEWRFRQELTKLPHYQREGAFNQTVQDTGFPAWRGLFEGLLAQSMTHYRLPSAAEFYQACERAFSVRFLHLFTEHGPGMRFRMGCWYESAMRDTHFGCAVVEAVEDRMQLGLVPYDSRLDVKMKTDLMVILRGRVFLVNAFVGKAGERLNQELQRERVERSRKENSRESSHWGNAQYHGSEWLEMGAEERDLWRVNGVPLYSHDQINGFLRDLYRRAGIDAGYQFGGRA